MKLQRANEKKAVFISIPMSGKDECLIKRAIQLTKRAYCRRNKVSAKEIFFYDNFTYTKEFERLTGESIVHDNVLHGNIMYLSAALCGLSYCDEAIFGKGWKDARGCKIEYETCIQYGIPIIDLEE